MPFTRSSPGGGSPPISRTVAKSERLRFRYVVLAQGESRTHFRIDAVFGRRRPRKADNFGWHCRIKRIQRDQDRVRQISVRRPGNGCSPKETPGRRQKQVALLRQRQRNCQARAAESSLKNLDPQIRELRHKVVMKVTNEEYGIESRRRSIPRQKIQSLPAGAEVVVLIVTPAWLGVETTAKQRGWLRQDQVESLPLKNNLPIFLLACAVLSNVPLSLQPQLPINLVGRSVYFIIRRWKSESDPRASCHLNGRLPILDGFADHVDERWDRFTRGYYECAVQVVVTDRTRRVYASRPRSQRGITDSNPSQSGYRVLLSNGHVESDLLDRIEEALAAKGGVSAAPQSSQSIGSSRNRPLILQQYRLRRETHPAASNSPAVDLFPWFAASRVEPPPNLLDSRFGPSLLRE